MFEARGNSRLDEQAVDDDFDGVVLTLINDWEIVERNQFSIDSSADVAVLREFFEFLAKGALTAAHDRRENHDAVVRLAEFAVENGLDDLLTGLARDGLAAIGAMRHADGGVDHAEVIVDFRDGADGGARRSAWWFSARWRWKEKGLR